MQAWQREQSGGRRRQAGHTNCSQESKPKGKESRHSELVSKIKSSRWYLKVFSQVRRRRAKGKVPYRQQQARPLATLEPKVKENILVQRKRRRQLLLIPIPAVMKVKVLPLSALSLNSLSRVKIIIMGVGKQDPLPSALALSLHVCIQSRVKIIIMGFGKEDPLLKPCYYRPN